jgi:hypothetical protein
MSYPAARRSVAARTPDCAGSLSEAMIGAMDHIDNEAALDL